MENPLAKQRKASFTISLSFDELQLVHMAFNHAVIDPPGEASSHCLFVFLDRSSKRLEFGELAACYLGQPNIEEFSRASTRHLSELLNEVIGPIDLRVKLTKLGYHFQLFSAQFFRSTKKQEGSLS